MSGSGLALTRASSVDAAATVTRPWYTQPGGPLNQRPDRGPGAGGDGAAVTRS